MDIKRLAKKDGLLEFQLLSEDHTFANLLRELSWAHRAEATYKVLHPLLGQPIVKIVSTDPKGALDKTAKDISKLCRDTERALK